MKEMVGMLALERWQVGRVLRTWRTARWPQEALAEAEAREARRVFKNFTPVDAGRSRELIAVCLTADMARAVVDSHNALIDLCVALNEEASGKK